MSLRFLVPLFAACIGLPAVAAVSQSLDGEWMIARDASDAGLAGKWFEPGQFPISACRPVPVPGNINEAWPNPASVTSPEAANLDWYRLAFRPSLPAGQRYYLRFGAVRYLSQVWLNGTELGSHEGSQDPFEFDVTDVIKAGGPNTLILRVSSPYFGGINQHVSLVAQPAVRIIDVFARPDANGKVMHLDITLENNTAAPTVVVVQAHCAEFRSKAAVNATSLKLPAPMGRSTSTVDIAVANPHLWDLDDPFLYKVDVQMGMAGGAAAVDSYSLRTGFRDFRIENGYFRLNGRRIFLKSTHGNWYEPVAIQGNSRDDAYIKKDLTQLKGAGFNTLRLIISAALPEQLEAADELGLLVYSEHETSWQLKDPERFGVSLDGLVRRDRNHPSLVMWGMLNETTSLAIFAKARARLPEVRKIDPTRLIMMSSGRWDQTFTTGSASNPGSERWDVFLGGEDPVHPVPTAPIKLPAGAFYNGTGDAHVYQQYPTSWEFISAFERLAENTHPFLLSEAGDGSSYDPFDEKRKLEAAGAPTDAYAYSWIEPALAGLAGTWKRYGLDGEYPSMERMVIDSALAQSRQRAITFSYVRANPKVNGFNLTSLNDCWGSGEGFLDNFQDFKPGHEAVMKEGWAPLRWCILTDAMHVYAGHPLHLRVSLSNEDVLAAGSYPATVSLVGDAGAVWSNQVRIEVPEGRDPPFAFLAFDGEVTVPPTAVGKLTVHATLNGRTNAAASTFDLVADRSEDMPKLSGRFTVCGLGDGARALLTRQGATLEDYAAGGGRDREVILVGDGFHGTAEDWAALYQRVADGAAVVFYSPAIFAESHGEKKDALRWLALPRRGTLVEETEWLYHKDIVAKRGPDFAGLPTGLMTPDYYEMILAHAPFFEGIATPDVVGAVAIREVADGAAKYVYHDGIELGCYRWHGGQFTLCSLDLLGNLGHPAADHLFLNLARSAATNASALAPTPIDLSDELARLGIAGTD